MLNIRVVMVVAVLYAGGVCAGGENLSDGQAIFESVCATCHGENGEGSEDFSAPRLAGQHGWYLRTQLLNFRAGVRGVDENDENGQIMQPMAADLEDQAIENLVAYIGTLK